jgi:hypothetical protein
MTLKEQLLQEIEQAPDSVIEELLSFCRQMKTEQGALAGLTEGQEAERIAAQREAVSRLQAKARETVAAGRSALPLPPGSLVDELIAERRAEAENE